jgi:hypothetical protein
VDQDKKVFCQKLTHYSTNEERLQGRNGMLCISCEQDLPETSFSPGFLKRSKSFHICRKCKNEKIKQYQRENRAKIDGYNRKYWDKYPEKQQAKLALASAVKTGRIQKEHCPICGTSDVEGHHFSYAPENWLKVIWVCSVHHKAIHGGEISIEGLPVTEGRQPGRKAS